MVKKRQPLAPTPPAPPEPKTTWQYIKSLFLYSETILIARAATVFGTVITTIGGFDFSPLWSLFSTGTDFTQKQLLFVGIAVIGTGITLELARRRGATTL